MKPLDETLADMAQATGARITKAEVREIWEEVKRNRQTLDACSGPHDFSEEAERTGTLVQKWRCTKCHGAVGAIEKAWYERGLAHGRRAMAVQS